jgi:putative FmdB family regulatory protein
MPIYAYRCDACGHAKDVLQKLSDPVLSVCPACGADSFRKQLTAAGFQLKGSGWYVTDFKGGAQAAKGGEAAAAGGDAKPADGAKPDAGAAKPAEGGAAPASSSSGGGESSSGSSGGGSTPVSAAGCGSGCGCH